MADCDLCRIVDLGANESVGKGRWQGASQLPLMDDGFKMKNATFFFFFNTSMMESILKGSRSCSAGYVYVKSIE